MRGLSQRDPVEAFRRAVRQAMRGLIDDSRVDPTPLEGTLFYQRLAAEMMHQLPMGAIATFSTYGFYGPSSDYAKVLFHRLHASEFAPTFSIIFGGSGMVANTMQAWEIMSIFYHLIHQKDSDEERFLFDEETWGKRLGRHKLALVNGFFAFIATLAIADLSIDDTNVWVGSAIGLLNFPVAYEGIDKFVRRIKPRHLGQPPSIHLIADAQYAIADAMEMSFKNFLRPDGDPGDNSRLYDKVMSFDAAMTEAEFIEWILHLPAKDTSPQANQNFDYQFEVVISPLRRWAIVFFMILAALVQDGYWGQSYVAGRQAGSFFGWLALIVAMMVYSGLTGESVHDVGVTNGTGHRELASILNPRAYKILSYSTVVVGCFSGMTLAMTCYLNFTNPETALLLFPAWLGIINEIFSAWSDGTVNINYALGVNRQWLKSWYRNRSNDEFKCRLIVLEEKVDRVIHLIKHTKPWYFAKLLTSNVLPLDTIHRLFIKRGFTDAQVTHLFSGNAHLSSASIWAARPAVPIQEFMASSCPAPTR